MKYDLIVIGSGPGGYVAAIRAAQLGLKTAIIEREEIGGICLNWGCIPTKALLKSAQVFNYIQHADDYGIVLSDAKPSLKKMVKRSRDTADKMSKGVQYLMKKNKIDVIKGQGHLARAKQVEVTANDGSKSIYDTDSIIVATGGRSRELPNIKIDGKNIIGYRKALALSSIPKRLVVIGGGAIGVEFAYFYASLGSEVTVVEYLSQGLLPREDADISKALSRNFKKIGIKTKANSAVIDVDSRGQSNKVKIKHNESGKEEVIECDIVLSAVGFSPNTENLGLEKLGVELDRGFVKVNDKYETNVPGIYAIGDVIPGPALAHVASAEGITCVEYIAGQGTGVIDYDNIPGCTYCQPEVASVGMTEQEALDAGYDLKIGKFPFSASGKASAAGANDGFVKLIFDSQYGELLGGHMIGANVTEMIAEIVAARRLETTGHELIKTIHPHPTMSEAVLEAAADAYGEVIHL